MKRLLKPEKPPLGLRIVRNAVIAVIFIAALSISASTDNAKSQFAPFESVYPADLLSFVSVPAPPVFLEDTGPIPVPDNRPPNPLTGLPMDPAFENRRPVAVMLNNLKAALPQYGNSAADIIFEVPAEGMITRMVAVYQAPADISQIGSVRSTRPYYVEIAQGLDAILVHAGGSPEAYSVLSSRKVDHLDGIIYDGRYFWRDRARIQAKKYEHSMFTSTDLISQGIGALGFRMDKEAGAGMTLTFSDDAAPYGGNAARIITIVYPGNYKTGKFEYNPSEKTYNVFQYGAGYTDAGSDSQVSAVNVLFLSAPISVIRGDSAGRLRVDLSGGDGYYANGGKYVPIRWSKASASAPFVFTGETGEALTFGKGRSYISIIPSGAKLTFEQAAEDAQAEDTQEE